jgi:flagellar L-ring protein precursor FlgH
MKRRIACALLLAALPGLATSKKKPPEPSPLERYAMDAEQQAHGLAVAATPGSIWTSGSQYADLARDLKASQANDMITIVVAESASAVTTGATKTERKSSANSSITALAGLTKAAGPLANLANLGGDVALDGSGTTSRQTTLNTTLTARVIRVLPNGYMIVEGTKDVQVNSEHQTVTVRGVVRPADLATDNSVPSDRLAQVEIHLNGKGVVNDAIHRPFSLYRLLLGLLPF